MIPSASDLTYFVEVANTQNLSRASERLGIKQPSLTLAIQRLENIIGTKILTRNKKGVMLTQAGKQLLLHSKHLLQSWNQIKAETMASMSEIQGTFTLGCHPSVGLYTLSHFLPNLLKNYPKLDIQLKHEISRKVAEGIISSMIDIGIVVNPVRHPDLIIHKLCDDKFTLWTSNEKHSMQNFNAENPIIIYDPDLIQSQILLNQMKQSGYEINRVIASSNLEIVANLTTHGCGIGLLPTRVAMRMKNLHEIENSPILNDEICLLYRVENKNVKSIQTLSSVIREAFKA